MSGQVNAIKMMSLLRLLYLFQNMTTYLYASFFKKLIPWYCLLWGVTNHTGYLRLSFTNPQKWVVWDYLVLNTTTGRLTPGLLLTRRVEVIKLSRTLCGFDSSWLEATVKMSSLLTLLLSYSALAAKLIQWNFIVKKVACLFPDPYVKIINYCLHG